MTDSEKLLAVELALAGVKIEDMRDLAGTFSYVRRTGDKLQDCAQDFATLLEPEEFEVLNRVQLARGLDTLYRICSEVLEEYDHENPLEYRRDYMTDDQKILLVELELDGTLDEWRDACGNDYFVYIAQEECDRLCAMGLSEDSAKQCVHEFVMSNCDEIGRDMFTDRSWC
jgi:hypothetical protein